MGTSLHEVGSLGNMTVVGTIGERDPGGLACFCVTLN